MDAELWDVLRYVIGIVFASGIIYASLRGDTKRNTGRIRDLETGFRDLDERYITRRELKLIMNHIEGQLAELNDNIRSIKDVIIEYRRPIRIAPRDYDND